MSQHVRLIAGSISMTEDNRGHRDTVFFLFVTPRFLPHGHDMAAEQVGMPLLRNKQKSLLDLMVATREDPTLVDLNILR